MLLFVLLEAFLALVARQFAVGRPLGHALCLSSGARALRSNRISLYASDGLWILVALAHICWLDLSIDRIFVLTAGVAADAYLAAVVLMMWIHLVVCRSVADHVHVRAAVRVVLLPVVRRELVLVLQERVLGALRPA